MMSVPLQVAASPPPKEVSDVPKKFHSYAPPFRPTSSTEFSTHHQRTLVSTLQPLQMTSLQSNFIDDTMKELRERQAKRQKVCDTTRMMMVQHQDGASVDTMCSQHDNGRHQQNVGSSGTNANRFDILDALDSHPNTVQVVATSGGLINHWNEAFAKLINNSSQLKSRTLPLTIFEIIESKSLPSLYSILALALHNVRVVDIEDYTSNDDNSSSEKAVDEGVVDPTDKKAVDGPEDTTPSSSHLSITLPCKSFPNSSTHYNITIVFMNDASMKRCFLGILTPRCSSSSNADDGCSSSGTISSCSLASLQCGKILRVNDELLCRLLLG